MTEETPSVLNAPQDTPQAHDHEEHCVPFGVEDVNLWADAIDPDITDAELASPFGPHEHHEHHHHHHHEESPAEPPDARTTTTPDDTDAVESIEQPQKRSVICKTIDVIKYFCSAGILVFSLIIVTAAIFGKQTIATGEYGLHPAGAFIIFWVLLIWLALMEGGLNCMVGLQPVDKALYADSHRITVRCTCTAHRGDNIERFIVGRQFLDLMVVFVTSLMVSAIDNPAVLGLPPGVINAFFSSGLAVILVTIVFGQLTAQINSAHSMLDFINNYFMLATTYATLVVEVSGLLHAVYLVQIVVAKIARRPIDSNEPPRTTLKKILFWARVFMSTSVVILSFVVIIAAMFERQTTMWASVPPAASLVLLILLIGLVGIMEGLQIALFAVVHLPDDEMEQYPRAHRNCRLTFKGQNLQSFLVGRQICQTIIMFIIARITTVTAGDENLFGVSDGMQGFFNTGLLGALVSTIAASLSWRIVASTFPIAFLCNPLAYPIIQLCLWVEYTGICSISWTIAYVHRKLLGYHKDETYIGTPEERAAKAGELDRTEQGETSSSGGDSH